MSVSIHYQTKDKPMTAVKKADDIPSDATVVWYDLNEPTQAESDFLLTHFDFNPLEMDDTINANPRAKYKAYDDYQNIVFHTMTPDDYKIQVLNIFIKGKVLITYHHKKINELNTVFRLITNNFDQDLDCEDIVLYILDHIVDNYSYHIGIISDKVFTFEDEHGSDRSDKYMMDYIFDLRSDIIKLKRVIMPMKEVINTLQNESRLVQDERHSMYVQHIVDHIVKENSMLQTAQDISQEIRDNFESYTSFRMNRVMQILTIVSMIFLPLTLIAGVYGMNFTYMPELKWHYGYFYALALMLVVALGCLWYFKRKDML